jgi:hypothetical protein
MDASVHVSLVIAAAPDTVYRWAADPANLSRWAGGLASSPVEEVDGVLVVDSPLGRVTVVFAPPNAWGVLDHRVTLPAGEEVDNPMRVLAHPDGAEVVFTVRRRAEMTADDLDRDVAAVRADLESLRRHLEGAGASS